MAGGFRGAGMNFLRSEYSIYHNFRPIDGPNPERRGLSNLYPP